MSVKIRLTKTGKKHQISYRVIATDTRTKRDGKFLEILGFFNPQQNNLFKVNQERVNYWLSKGAKPSGAVAKLISERQIVTK